MAVFSTILLVAAALFCLGITEVGAAGHDPFFCLVCPSTGTTRADDCSERLCDHGEVCYGYRLQEANGDITFFADCVHKGHCDDPVPFGRRSPHHGAYHCCQGNMCNKDILPVTTNAPLPTDHVSTTDSSGLTATSSGNQVATSDSSSASGLFSTHASAVASSGATAPPSGNHVSVSDSTSATATGSTPKPLHLTTTPHTPVQCEICDSKAGCVLSPKVEACPSAQPFCMNTITLHFNGTWELKKGCASDSDCRTKWWSGSSDQDSCTHFNPLVAPVEEIECYICCTSNNCNERVARPEKSLYTLDSR